MAYANSVILYNCKLNHNGLFTCDFGGSGATRDSVMGSTNSLATVKFSYNNCTYMRENSAIVVNANADVLLANGINYCRYINPDFNNSMYFYAFVINIEYVAPSTTRVYIKTDPFMTYFHKIQKNECFVEREHVSNDAAFAHTLPEPTPAFESRCLRLHEKKWDSRTTVDINNDFYACAYAVHQIDPDDPSTYNEPIAPAAPVRYTGHTPSPGHLYMCFPDNAENMFNELIRQKYEIVYTILMPEDCVNMINTTVPDIYVADDKYTDQAINIASRSIDSIDYGPEGVYSIRNKKLNCYPYMYIELDDMNDQSIILKQEDMTSTTFWYHAESGSVPTLTLYCKTYQHNDDNFENSIALNNFPAIPYSIDFWTQYSSINKNQLEFEKKAFGWNVAKKAIGAVAAIASGGIAGYGAGAAYGAKIATQSAEKGMALSRMMGETWSPDLLAANSLNVMDDVAANRSYYGTIGAAAGASKSAINGLGGLVDTVMARMQQNAMYSDMKERPPQMHNASSGNTRLGIGAVGFHINRWVPKREYVELLDKFFDMYGYNVSIVKSPQWNSRTNYNYIKTSGANISGEIPQNDKEAINALLDAGLTIWHNVGSYGSYGANPIA